MNSLFIKNISACDVRDVNMMFLLCKALLKAITFAETKNKNKMKAKQKKQQEMEKFKTLSKEELSTLKGGGYWVYDECMKEWFWVES